MKTKKELLKFIDALFEEYPPTPKNIEHSLSNIYRYSGKGPREEWLTVWQHSKRAVLLLRSLSSSTDLAAKLKLPTKFHDSPEVYTSDIPSGVKRLFPDLVKFEDLLLRKIFKYNNIYWPSKKEWKIIRTCDIIDRENELKELHKRGFLHEVTKSK